MLSHRRMRPVPLEQRRVVAGVIGVCWLSIQAGAQQPQQPPESTPLLPASAILALVGLDGRGLAAVSTGVEDAEALVSSASETTVQLRRAGEGVAAGRLATAELAATERACGAGGATPERLESVAARLSRASSLEQGLERRGPRRAVLMPPRPPHRPRRPSRRPSSAATTR